MGRRSREKWGGGTAAEIKGGEVKREEVRSFAAAGAFIILSVSSSENPPPPAARRRAAGPVLFLLGCFSFLIFPLSLADILKVLNI